MRGLTGAITCMSLRRRYSGKVEWSCAHSRLVDITTLHIRR